MLERGKSISDINLHFFSNPEFENRAAICCNYLGQNDPRWSKICLDCIVEEGTVAGNNLCKENEMRSYFLFFGNKSWRGMKKLPP